MCINPIWVPAASSLLAGTAVHVCTVAGFPLGAVHGWSKALEASWAVEQGADEIDMVLNVGALKDGDFDVVRSDVASVVDGASGSTVKVILETGLLTTEEIRAAVRLSEEGGAAFVKTSTGFGPRGASVDDVRLMKAACEGRLQVKASGGIRTYEDALALLEAGASRLGASAGTAILAGCPPSPSPGAP